MPEAPEVQNVLDWLEDELKDHQITGASITHPKLSANMPADQMASRLEGEHVRSFSRRGKYLILDTDHYHWICHLRMEGKFLIVTPEELDNMEEKDKKHIHAVFDLDDGRKLCYRDTRKFGRMHLYDIDESLDTVKALENVGPDVLDQRLTPERLYESIHKKKAAIKTILLDQSVLAGIGNIYADEILFDARISPFEKGCDLTMEDCTRILEAARRILLKAIEMKGTTIRTFSFGNHEAGSFQDELKVHDKKDEPCPVCGHPIEMELINKRSTYYCPICQKLKQSD